MNAIVRRLIGAGQRLRVGEGEWPARMRAGASLVLVLALAQAAEGSEHRDKGYLYLSPLPGSEYASRQTRFVLVRFENISPTELTNLYSFVQVTGASSGIHAGQTRVASDNRTVIFQMTTDFTARELVTVSLTPGVAPGAGLVEAYEYQFRVSSPFTNFVAASAATVEADATPGPAWSPRPPQMDPPPEMAGVPKPRILPNGVSIPSDFPGIDIFTNNNPAPGYIFIDYDTSLDFAMILDNTGSPVWYKRGSRARDFKVQPNGMITMIVSPPFVGYDQNFNQVKTFRAVNGYNTDDHELQVLPNGGYLLFGIRGETVDMRRFVPAGKTNATVNETVLQEFTAEGDLVFQYRAWDNYDIRMMEYWSNDDKPTSQSIRFTHMNAVDVDHDGHLLVSNKRVSEVTKINRDTGEVIWRMGGPHPVPAQDPYLGQRLQIVNDPLGQFDLQHDIRVVGTNRYSLFDNHWLARTAASRAVEYQVDATNRTATLVWAYQETPPIESYHMGNAQRLPNGNTLINWVVEGAPKVTEVTPAGAKVFEMNWSAKNSKSYRVFRFPWEGQVAAPYLLAEVNADNITLLFNKFGDHSVDYYRVYGGTNANPAEVLETSAATLLRLYDLERGRRYYFRVTAVDTNGVESAFSNEINVLANLFRPGENMVRNGDFSQGTNAWTWQVSGTAAATWNTGSAQTFVHITSGGSALADIQLRQAGLCLVKGMDYVLSFDAWSTAQRAMEVRLGMDASPFTSHYSSSAALTPVRQTFTRTFTMQNTTDSNARIMFNLGASTTDLFLDNVSVVMIAPGDFDRDGCIGFDDLKVWSGAWLRVGSGLVPDLDANGKVDFGDMGILGENWAGVTCP